MTSSCESSAEGRSKRRKTCTAAARRRILGAGRIASFVRGHGEAAGASVRVDGWCGLESSLYKCCHGIHGELCDRGQPSSASPCVINVICAEGAFATPPVACTRRVCLVRFRTALAAHKPRQDAAANDETHARCTCTEVRARNTFPFT